MRMTIVGHFLIKISHAVLMNFVVESRLNEKRNTNPTRDQELLVGS